MRRVLAALLLFCVGMMIPASASHLRICFLDLGWHFSPEDSDCCDDCSRDSEEPDPCCHDLEKLPDTSAPQDPVELPPVVVADILSGACLASHGFHLQRGYHLVSTPIRGPTSLVSCRAKLGIWRL
jgi:hypothetical protein